MSTQDEEQLITEAWKHYAEACCEHDCAGGQRACAELARLIPQQPGSME